MQSTPSKKADNLLRQLESKFGTDPFLVKHLQPVLVRIYDTAMKVEERDDILRLVVETYAGHLKIRTSIQKLRKRIRNRLNEIYSRVLGIQQPGLDI